METIYDNDTALRQAANRAEKKSKITLPSNFAFTTMRRIEAERRRAARRNKAMTVMAIGMVCIAGIAALAYLYGGIMVAAVRNMANGEASLSYAIMTTVCLTFFATLDFIMRRRMNL